MQVLLFMKGNANLVFTCLQTNTHKKKKNHSLLYYCSPTIYRPSRTLKNVFFYQLANSSQHWLPRVWCSQFKTDLQSVTSQLFFNPASLFFSTWWIDEWPHRSPQTHWLSRRSLSSPETCKRQCWDLLNELNKGVIYWENSYFLLQIDFRELGGGLRSASSKPSL